MRTDPRTVSAVALALGLLMVSVMLAVLLIALSRYRQQREARAAHEARLLQRRAQTAENYARWRDERSGGGRS